MKDYKIRWFSKPITQKQQKEYILHKKSIAAFFASLKRKSLNTIV